MKNILIFFIVVQSSYSINLNFFRLDSSYFALHNNRIIQVNNNEIRIFENDTLIYQLPFIGIKEVKATQFDDFKLFLYYQSLSQTEYRTSKFLNLFDMDGNIIGEIKVSNNQLICVYDGSTKVFKLNETTKIIPNLLGNPNYKIEWSKYLSGSENDYFLNIAIDSLDNIYASGNTSSIKINELSPIGSSRGASDILLAKMDKEGDFKWIAVVGGSRNDYNHGLVIDRNNNIWICGESSSENYYTKNNIQQLYTGGTADGVLTKFNGDGNIIYSTYYGGSDYDAFTDITTDLNNKIWLTGRTASKDFKTTSNAVKKVIIEYYESPILRFSDTGVLEFSGFFGGLQNGALTLADCIKADSEGNIILGGYSNSSTLPTNNNSYQKNKSGGFDSFIAKLNPTGVLIWCTYIGGSSFEYGYALDIDSKDNVILCSVTGSYGLQVFNSSLQNAIAGSLDIYITKFSALGDLIWSSYFGGKGTELNDYGGYIKLLGNLSIDALDNYYLCFHTNSDNLPTDDNSLYKKLNAGTDNFILILDQNSNRIYSTYLGGSNDDLSGDLLPLYDEKVLFVGSTTSQDFYVTESSSLFGGNIDGYCGLLFYSNTISSPPTITTNSKDNCNTSWYFEVSDSNNAPKGITSYQTLLAENCDISFELKNIMLVIRVKLIDNYQSGRFKVEIKNKAGKSIIIDEFLEGIVKNADLTFFPDSILDFGTTYVEKPICKDILIKNSSGKDFVVDNLPLSLNVDFSIPQSQLPITILANSTKSLRICFMPIKNKIGIYYDTVKVNDNCSAAMLPLTGKLWFTDYSSDSKCEVNLVLNTDSSNLLEKSTTIYIGSDNDASNLLLFSAPENDRINSIELFDINGRVDRNFTISIKDNNYQLDLSDLNNGQYFLMIKTKKHNQLTRIIVNK